jgi:Lrp/AsnC family transcriptional regulator
MVERNNELDEADRRILRLLQSEPHLTVRDIGERTGLSHSPVWRRLSRLRQDGIVEERRYVIDPARIGYDVTAFCAVRMDGHSREHLEAFEAAVEGVEEVIQCHSISGDHDYMLQVIARSIAHYERTVKTRLLALPHVLTIATSFALRQVKRTTRVPL